MADETGPLVPKPTMSLELSFQTAMVDAINIFVRTVLVPRGIVDPERVEDIGSKDVLQEKYRITQELAAAWARMLSGQK